MELLVILMAPLLFTGFIHLLETPSPNKRIPMDKNNWEDEQTKAIAYSRNAKGGEKPSVIKEVTVLPSESLLPNQERSTFPYIENLKAYLRTVCYEQRDLLDFGAYRLDVKETEQHRQITLYESNRLLLKATIQYDVITSIDYGLFGEADRHLVRQYFERVLDEVDLEAWVKSTEKALKACHFKESVREKKQAQQLRQQEVLSAYDHNLVLLDQLEENALTIEWQHKVSQHMRLPLTQMLTQYQALGTAEQERTHAMFLALLQESSTLLAAQIATLGEAKIEQFYRNAELLKQRLESD